jgi:hypothetical protein
MVRPSVYKLIESASRQLAPTKFEMEVWLDTAYQLRLDEGADPEYLRDFQKAKALLEQSADIPSFISRLRAETDAPPTSGKLKNLLWLIVGVLIVLVLATLNDIVRAVAPRWFQCLWGLC